MLGLQSSQTTVFHCWVFSTQWIRVGMWIDHSTTASNRYDVCGRALWPYGGRRTTSPVLKVGGKYIAICVRLRIMMWTHLWIWTGGGFIYTRCQHSPTSAHTQAWPLNCLGSVASSLLAHFLLILNAFLNLKTSPQELNLKHLIAWSIPSWTPKEAFCSRCDVVSFERGIWKVVCLKTNPLNHLLRQLIR